MVLSDEKVGNVGASLNVHFPGRRYTQYHFVQNECSFCKLPAPDKLEYRQHANELRSPSGIKDAATPCLMYCRVYHAFGIAEDKDILRRYVPASLRLHIQRTNGDAKLWQIQDLPGPDRE